MREWHNEPASDLQKKKILSLMSRYPQYKLLVNLDVLKKGQAHSLISLLLEKNLSFLLEKRILAKDSSESIKERPKEKQIYRISEGDDLAAYSVFRNKVKGKLLQYELHGSDIVFQIIEVLGEIPADILNATDLKVEKL
ncbi:hypothetical protein [Proteiniclasticum ruminis]|uniref:Uncharacterized protein n=1 Tax=Proteiniclasticum ruminis TaxID=398199 RepID=A0A1G8QD91_9CLOT|nr:hypothetical protein [Proteiniclasticum ruminis]SDJ02598.1 hypothetical protein SAMN05421804_106108 [Proteiniclasticum ruminis]